MIKYPVSKKVLVVTCLLSFALSGCSDSDDSANTVIDQGNVTDQGSDLSESERSIIGLWDSSFRDTPESALDVFYIQITSGLRYRELDYRGDGVDLGDNCYTEFVDGGYPITTLANDSYAVEPLDITLTVENNVLIVTEGLDVERLPRLENISPLDINICT